MEDFIIPWPRTHKKKRIYILQREIVGKDIDRVPSFLS